MIINKLYSLEALDALHDFSGLGVEWRSSARRREIERGVFIQTTSNNEGVIRRRQKFKKNK